MLEFMKRIDKTRIVGWIQDLILYIILSFEAFIVVMDCTLNPWTEGRPAQDSSVFKYVAYVIQNGGMPYKDTFDHKGPVLYLFNLLGNKIAYWVGVWIVELGLMCLFTIALYSIARLFCKRMISVILASVTIFSIADYYNAGNYAEEYILSFVAIATYIFIDYFLNDKINKIRLVICGFCFATVLLTKINLIPLWIVFCIAVLIKNIYENKTFPVRFLGWFMLGALALIGPILTWLAVNGAFSDFINQYWFFNLKYSGSDSLEWYQRYGAIMAKIKHENYIIAIASIVYLITKKKNIFFNSAYLVYLLLILVMISLGGRTDAYYGMLMIPAIVYPYAAVCEYWIEKGANSGTIFVYILCLIIMIFPSVEFACDIAAYNIYAEFKAVPMKPQMREMFAIIDENTDEDERIQVIGAYNFVYDYSKRLSASRFSYQIPIAQIDENIKMEFDNDLLTLKPKIVVLEKKYDELFITKADYDMIFNFEDELEVYRLKEL